MRIIHLVESTTWGGQEQYVYELVKQLKNENWCSPYVICKDIPLIAGNFNSLNIPIQKMNLNGYLDFKTIIALARVLDKNGNCIVHVHDFKRAFIAIVARKLSRNKNIRVFVTRHLVRQAKKSFLENYIYKNVDKIIFVSELAKKTFLSTSPNINPDKCNVISNGVKDTYCDKDNLRKTYNIPDNEFVMMYHGRITPEKGIDIIIDALQKLKNKFNWRMVFVGDDDSQYVASIKKRIKKIGLEQNVIWTGYQSNVAQWIGGCDCGIIPTIVQEAFGLSNVEYMMAGKTVITTNNGAQTEYIKNGENGILIPTSNSEILAETIEDLYKTKKYIEIGSNARRYYEQYLNHDIFYNKIIKTYHSQYLELQNSKLESAYQYIQREHDGSANDNKTVVVTVVWRDMTPKERGALKQGIKVLGKRHAFVVLHPNSYQAGYLKEQYPEIELMPLPDENFKGIDSYNKMMLNPWFYSLFPKYEYMLVYQIDAYVFNDQLDYWTSLGYDYIGAPWMLNDKPFNRLIRQWFTRLLKLFPVRNNKVHSAHLFHEVGNGGFSLRRIPKMKEIMEKNQDLIKNLIETHYFQEDVVISILLKEKEKLKMPNWHLALNFSFEKSPAWCFRLTHGVLPFGCHDTQGKYWDSFWKYHIKLEE